MTPFSGVRGEESSGPEPGELMEMSLDLIRQSLLLAASRTTPPVLYDGRYKSFNRFETKSYSKIAAIGEVNINCNPHIFFHPHLTLILTRPGSYLLTCPGLPLLFLLWERFSILLGRRSGLCLDMISSDTLRLQILHT